MNRTYASLFGFFVGFIILAGTSLVGCDSSTDNSGKAKPDGTQDVQDVSNEDGSTAGDDTEEVVDSMTDGMTGGDDGMSDTRQDTHDPDNQDSTDKADAIDAADGSDGQSDADASDGDDPTACSPTDDFTGQIGGGEPNGGGQPDKNGSLSTDANLQAVKQRIEDRKDTSGIQKLDSPITVDGATITAVGFPSDTQFFVQDANTALEIYLSNPNQSSDSNGSDGEDTAPPFIEQNLPLKVGSKVKFEVTHIQNFEGTPQISWLGSFTVQSEDNSVPFAAKTGEEIAMDDYAKMVRVVGKLGAGTSCGGNSLCYPLKHGPNSDKSVTFRSNCNSVSACEKGPLEEGDCVAFVGPVSSHPGPLGAPGGDSSNGDTDSPEPTPQLDTYSYDFFTKK